MYITAKPYRFLIVKLIIQDSISGIRYKYALKWMPQNLTNQ